MNLINVVFKCLWLIGKQFWIITEELWYYTYSIFLANSNLTNNIHWHYYYIAHVYTVVHFVIVWVFVGFYGAEYPIIKRGLESN